MKNKDFWNLVKKIINVKKVNDKPCHYYFKNKDKVNKLYTEMKKSNLRFCYMNNFY